MKLKTACFLLCCALAVPVRAQNQSSPPEIIDFDFPGGKLSQLLDQLTAASKRHINIVLVDGAGDILEPRAAWFRIAQEIPASKGPISARLGIWVSLAAAAAVGVAVVWHRRQSPATLPKIVVEIVSTRDIPPAYVEISDAGLTQLFPHGLVIARGTEPQVFTFEDRRP